MSDPLPSFTGCTYTTATQNYDGTIVGPRSGNDFRFFGLNAGPGISVNQLPNSVEVSQSAAFNPVGLYMNMGDDITHFSQIDYYPPLSDSGFGQYNDGIYADGFITVPLTASYFVSIMVSHIGRDMILRLEDSDGDTIGYSVSNYSTDGLNTVSFTKILDLQANTRLRVRVSSYVAGTLFLSKSRITFSTL